MRMIVFVFSFNTEFLILSVCCLAGPCQGARATAVKLNPLKQQVKIQRCRLLTVVFTFFLIFFNQHIVDSVF